MKFSSIKLAALLALCALPFGLRPAIAQSISPIEQSPAGWYGSISPGATFGYSVNTGTDEFAVPNNSGQQNSRLAPSNPTNQGTTTVPLDLSIDTDTGFGVTGAVGYRFENNARVELGVGYNRNSVNSVSVNGTSNSASGQFDTFAVTVSGLYDIPTDSNIRPYVGGGVGLAGISSGDVDVVLPGVGASTLNTSGISPVIQAQAGVAYDFSNSSSAFIGYRGQMITNQSFSVNGTELDSDSVFSHTLEAGARLTF